ncbi:MAG: hypothetical protein Q9222_001774 [Ikaeria aurantiellina]
MSGRLRGFGKAVFGALGFTAINLSGVGIDVDPIIYEQVEDIIVETLTLPAGYILPSGIPSMPMTIELPSNRTLIYYADKIVWFLVWACLAYYLLLVAFAICFDIFRWFRRSIKRRPPLFGARSIDHFQRIVTWYGDPKSTALVLWTPPISTHHQVTYEINAFLNFPSAIVRWQGPRFDDCSQIIRRGGMVYLAAIEPFLESFCEKFKNMANDLRTAIREVDTLDRMLIELERTSEEDRHQQTIDLHHLYREERHELQQARQRAKAKKNATKEALTARESEISDLEEKIATVEDDARLVKADNANLLEENIYLMEENERITEQLSSVRRSPPIQILHFRRRRSGQVRMRRSRKVRARKNV